MPEDREKRKGSDDTRHGNGPRPLAASVGGLARRALGKTGMATAGLLTEWPAIVGPELAAACRPDRLSFPPGQRDGGTLRVLVSGGFATELQHLQPLVLERINGHFGYRAVERLALVNAAPSPAPAAKRTPPPRRPPDPAALQAFSEEAERVEDPEIRAALMRLGRAMLEDAASQREPSSPANPGPPRSRRAP